MGHPVHPSGIHCTTEGLPVAIVSGVDAVAAPQPLRHRLHLGDRGQHVAVVGRGAASPGSSQGSHRVVERGRVSAKRCKGFFCYSSLILCRNIWLGSFQLISPLGEILGGVTF